MKKSTLTDDTAAEIIKLMQEQYASKSREIAAAVLWNKKWFRSTYACYRYVHELLVDCERNESKPIKGHPDHFGIVFQGWSGSVMTQGIEKIEVSVWLDHLLDPNGPFREILPHLYHTTTKEILEDKGFVIKDALSCNAGLLWTFLQATRLMYENFRRMAPFMYGVKELRDDMPMALFCAFALKPCDTDFKLWATGNCAHGEPMGHYAYVFAHEFLNGKLTKCDEHTTSRSFRCFGDHLSPPYSYRNHSICKPFAEWVKKFNEKRSTPLAKAA
jgi:hypothetical protein